MEYSGEGQEESQGKIHESDLHRAKATTKDSEAMAWDRLRNGALVTRTGLAEDIHRNRKQRAGVEATGEEAAVFRHLANVSRMSINFFMAIIGLSSLKGSVIQREEQANSITERGNFVEERQLSRSRRSASTLFRRDTAPVTTFYEVILWEKIQTNAVKETAGDLGIVVAEGVVRD